MVINDNDITNVLLKNKNNKINDISVNADAQLSWLTQKNRCYMVTRDNLSIIVDDLLKNKNNIKIK